MEVTRPCEIVSSDEFHSISQELIWDYFPEEVKEAPPGCTEAEQQPAACRPVIIKQDETLEHKEPKAESRPWFDRHSKLTNDTEILFLACILSKHAESVAEVREWCSLILDYHEAAWKDQQAAGGVWNAPAEWKVPGNAAVGMLSDAYWAEWPRPMLEHVSNAMQSWGVQRGPGGGQQDGLGADRLKKHKAWASEKKVIKQGLLKARLLAALIPVARLLKSHGAALRHLLKLDASVELVPTAVEALQAERAAKAALEKQLEAKEVQRLAEQKAAQKIADAHRKLKGERERKRKAVTKARLEERKKAAAAKKVALDLERTKLAERLQAAAVRLEDRARSDVADTVAKLKVAVSKARARAREVEGAAKASVKRLRRAQTAETKAKELQAELDGLMEEAETEDEAGSSSTDEPSRGRRNARGQFEAGDWRLRPIEWAQLARRVPTGAVGANVRDVLRVHAPDVEYAEPCEREMRKRRIELTIAGECMANFRVGLALRIISFGSDESTKFGLGLLSTNTQIEPHDAPGTSVDVVQRGATLTAGGTAEAIAKSIDTKLMSHGRQLISGWRDQHESMFGKGSWAAAGGPDSENLGMHRLAENTVIMGDTCSTAEKTKRIVCETAEAAARAKISEAQWEAMSEEQRTAKCKAHLGRCHQHLRNIVINAMQLQQNESLKEELQDDLQEFASFDRMTADVNDLIRAASKELHAGQSYAKGKGREGEAWRKSEERAHVHLPYERAEGSRQDIALDGAVPIFWNRVQALNFLQGLMVPGADNRLEKYLIRSMSCNQMTAALRVNTLWKYLYSEPARWLAGKAGELSFGLDDASELVDVQERMMVAIAADGSKLLDPTWDPWAPLAAKYPAFDTERQRQMAKIIKSPDGMSHPIHKLILAEARDPSGAGNKQATPRVVELAAGMANAALAAMRDPRRAISDLLLSQDGKFSVGKDPSRNKATAGAHITNDRVESNFGCVDTLMRMFRYATVEAISGMAQQMRNHDFDTPPTILSDRGKRKHEQKAHAGGFFYTGLSVELQESLVTYVRRSADTARDAGRAALKAQDAEKMARREERVITLLKKHVEQYAYAMELYDAWAAPGGERARTTTQIQAALLDANGRQKPEAQQLEYLRRQVEMRVLGLGWTQYATRWSSSKSSRIGTVAHLQALLEEIVAEERTRERFSRGTEKGLPAEAAPPQGEWRDSLQLGTLDADAQAVRSQTRFNAQELRQKADQERQRRVAAGIADGVEAAQPDHPPAFDQQLVGKQLEVLWKYFTKGANDKEEPTLIWSTGRVVRVADGKSDKRSARCTKPLPGGTVLWAWDADPEFGEVAGEQWLTLLPKKWNPRTHKQVYSWRYDPRELGAAQAPPADPRRKNARRVVDDV